jgi:hypothetical protein
MIPCKRPPVPVVEHQGTAVAYCRVTGCGWEYGPGVKTDVNENATRHRQGHRAAVPAASVTTLDTGYGAECECGWSVGADRTRTDAQASLDYHLSAAHGLVAS